MGPHVETELIAYLDEELEAQKHAQVEAHLQECTACTAELDRLRVLRRDLGATFDTALSPIHLPADADARIRDRLRARLEPRPWHAIWRRRGLLAQAALAILALVFALNTTHVLRLPSPAAPHETLVLGQANLSPGSQAALRVIVRSTGEAKPVKGADVVVRIGRTPGLAQIVYAGQTDDGGTSNVAFTVPQDLEGEASLVVETASAGSTDTIVHPITIARDYKLLLYSDKPAYRAGQTIRARTLALDSVDFKPAVAEQVTFSIIDASDRRLSRQTVPASRFGIAAFEFTLPPEAPDGVYTLRAILGETVSERTVSVGEYDLPAFRVTLETERAFYAPGERVTGSVNAAYFFGQPVAGGKVTLRGYTTDPRTSPAIVVQGQTDDNGTASFAFHLPPGFGDSATQEPIFVDLEAVVTDGAGQQEGIREFLPVTAQSISIRAVPESGLLKPGVENVVYILTAYPDGRSVKTSLTIEVDGQAHTLSTNPYGLAEFRYVPDRTGILTIYAEDEQGASASGSFQFQADSAPQTILLRTERAAYEVGDTLRAEVLAGGSEPPQTIYVDIIRSEQIVAALSAPVEDGRAVFALDLDPTLAGTLELHAYHVDDAGQIARDTRLVMVDAPRQVSVAVQADQETYRPGETAHLQIQTALTSANGRMGESTNERMGEWANGAVALGIGVVDESVYALETLPPGFVRTYFLMEQELRARPGQGLDVSTLLDAGEDTDIRAAQDVAARAAWAGVRGTEFTLSEESIAEPEQDTAAIARVALANRIGLALALLPLLLGIIVTRGLHVTGVLKRTLRRVGIGALALTLASPVLGLIGCGALFLLWSAAGIIIPLVILALIVAILAWLAIHGWVRRDTRVQIAAGLLAIYVLLGGLMVVLAARGGDPAGLLLVAIAASFLLVVAAVATLGQGLIVEGWRITGWATTAMGLLLIPLAICLPFVPGAASGLTRTLGNPALYAGPVGWLTGCCPMAAPTSEPTEQAAPAATDAPAEPTEESHYQQAPMLTAIAATEELAEPTPVPAMPTPTPAPAATPIPTATPAPEATPVPLPAEPYPLRQVFPETLYWDAEAVTDENGALALDLELADSVTTWWLTALASTQDGDLGATTYDIVVFQDLFLTLDLPQTITRGETITVTVTVYNALDRAQTIQIEPQAAEWYTLESPPAEIAVPAGGAAPVTFAIRAEQTGDFVLQVNGVGEEMSDRVAGKTTVVEAQ